MKLKKSGSAVSRIYGYSPVHPFAFLFVLHHKSMVRVCKDGWMVRCSVDEWVDNYGKFVEWDHQNACNRLQIMQKFDEY